MIWCRMMPSEKAWWILARAWNGFSVKTNEFISTRVNRRRREKNYIEWDEGRERERKMRKVNKCDGREREMGLEDEITKSKYYHEWEVNTELSVPLFSMPGGNGRVCMIFFLLCSSNMGKESLNLWWMRWSVKTSIKQNLSNFPSSNSQLMAHLIIFHNRNYHSTLVNKTVSNA